MSIWAEVLAAGTSSSGSASVSSKISPQTRNILVLGESQSGKKSLIQQLRHETGSGLPTTAKKQSSQSQINNADESSTIGLSFDYVDLRDDEDETLVLGRLGFYTLNYSTGLRPSILQHCKPEMIIITLDWSQPWQFLESLSRWLAFIEQSPLCTAVEKPAQVERQERVRRYLQEFGSQTTSAVGNAFTTLAEGCLLHNIGIPLAVVCTKADQLHKLEQEAGFKEPHVDFIQQTLRTACLQYGASLFYTTQFRPETLNSLRLYLAHRLFGWTDRWTAEEQHQDTSGTAAHKTISYKTLLPAVFPLQPQVVEKDTVMVPAGWDSWGKIKILRESFDCESINLQSAGCLQSFLGTLPPQPAFTKRTTMVVNNNDNVHLEIRLEDEQQFLSQQAAVLAASEEEAKTDDVAVRLKRLSKLKESSSANTPLSTPQKSRLDPSAVASPSAGGGESGQNQVLANFFQSLLNKKGGDGATRSAVAAELNKLRE